MLQTIDRTWKIGFFIDDIIHDLAKEITDGMASRPCITFINGEYWGIYKIRERIDKHYIASYYEANMFEHATLEGGSSWPNPDRATLLYRSLMKNEAFRTKLVARLLYLMENDFSPQKVIDKIDEYTSLYEPELEEHFTRWKTGGNMKNWSRDLEKMKAFARNRPLFIKSVR